MQLKKIIARAGFIPYYKKDGQVYILCMKPSDPAYGGDAFQIAKGRVDPGENTKQTAIREAGEELGLIPSNIKAIKHLGVFLGYTDMFYGEVKDKDNFTHTTHETENTKWMTVEEFFKEGRSLHRDVIKAFAAAIA
jgi:8-oxo-dGTP pyrophosphatase MutT (NUDIX family)